MTGAASLATGRNMRAPLSTGYRQKERLSLNCLAGQVEELRKGDASHDVLHEANQGLPRPLGLPLVRRSPATYRR
jgi:hypothetical protein